MFSSAKHNRSGQGALEYLLLIGGAVLVATIVMVLALTQIFPQSEGIVNENISGYQSHITLGAFGGGSGSLCVGGAPNGTQEGSEECDGSDFGGLTCDDFTGGGSTGSLSCTSNCTINSSACAGAGGSVCGNGIIEGTEQCDGAALGGETCVSQGFSGGSLTCFPSGSPNECTFDTSACTAPPATFSGFAVGSPISLGNGYARWNFTWSGAQFLPGIGATKQGIGPGPIGFIYPASQSGAFGLETLDALAAANPTIAPHPPFSASSGSGQAGTLSNLFIKSVLVATLGQTTPSFVIVGDDGGTNYALGGGGTATSSYVVDAEAPVVPTPAISTGTGNGGQLLLSWTQPQDFYLGGAYLSTTGWGIVYSTSAINAGNIDGLIAAGQQIGSTAIGTNPVNQTIDYTTGTPGLSPSTGYFTALRVCDIPDGATLIGTPNCTDFYSASAQTSSKEARLWEAETMTPGAGLQVASPGTVAPETVINALGSPTCSASTNSATLVLSGMKVPSSATVNYTFWARVANPGGAAGNARLNLGSGVQTISVPASTAALTWLAAPTQVTGVGQSPTASLIVTCDSLVLPSPNVYVDKVLITTDTACVPTGDGSNCA